MSNRIRYVKSIGENPVLTSVRVFTVGDMSYKVELHAARGMYYILNATDDVSVLSGMGASMSNLKIKAKKALMGLGVVFEKESRSSSYGKTMSVI